MGLGEQGTGSQYGLRQRVKRAMRRFNRSSMSDSLDRSLATPQQLRQRLYLSQLEQTVQKEKLRDAELALAHSRARFIDLLEYTSTLYNLAPVGYLTLTEEGIVIEANQTAFDLLKVQRELLLQQPLAYFMDEHDRATFHTFLRQLQPTQPAQRCELRMLTADGSHFFAQLDAIFTRNILGDDELHGTLKNGPYVRITISDISVRVQLEEDERRLRTQLEETLQDLQQTQEQMVKQERLAVVGQMAAGIAHDFNNIMASITLYAQLVMRAPELPPALSKRMEAIVTQSDRAANLVQQILDFSRRTVMTRQLIALGDFLQQFVEMLQSTMPDTIQVVFDHTVLRLGTDDIVHIDTGRIQQAMLNLALNARDAMPEGGNLRISLSRLQADADLPVLASGTLPAGSWLRIAVSDTGAGIRSEDLPHLFEPFFTTKGVGLGSGLGLSQVWGLVKQHDGEIDVESEVGVGTTFTVYLPASPEVPAAIAPPKAEPIPHGDGELVLVAEDSDFLRVAVVSALRQLGYQTLAANNGQEAFDLVIKETDKIKLILSDLNMPIMGGKELIRAVRAQGWRQPVIILTGHPLSGGELEQLLSYGQVTKLQKPIVIDRLAQAIAQVLNNPVA